jgi:hypothetical protein
MYLPSKSSRISLGSTPAPTRWAPGVPYPNEAWVGLESDYPLRSSVEVKNECSYALGLGLDDMCLIKCRELHCINTYSQCSFFGCLLFYQTIIQKLTIH